MLVIIVVFLNMTALFLLWREVINSRKTHLRLRQRITWLDGDADGEMSQPVNLHRKTNELPGLFSWMMQPLPAFERLGDRLEYLQKNVTAKQYVLRRVMISLIIFLTVSVLLKYSWLLGLVLALAFGVLLPLKMLQRAVDKRTKAFLKLFSDAIDLIVRGLRAGLPVSESIMLVSREIEEPVGSVFATIINTLKLGVPLEKALREEARKLDIPEFNFFTIAVSLQHETGGNLTEILNNLAEVLRNRSRMLLKIKAISAEARASSYVLASLPFIIIGGFSLLSPNYLIPLYQDPRGHICLGAAMVMLILGLFIMRRMTQFEI